MSDLSFLNMSIVSRRETIVNKLSAVKEAIYNNNCWHSAHINFSVKAIGVVNIIGIGCKRSESMNQASTVKYKTNRIIRSENRSKLKYRRKDGFMDFWKTI